LATDFIAMHETRLLVGIVLAAMGCLYALIVTALMWRSGRRKSYTRACAAEAMPRAAGAPGSGPAAATVAPGSTASVALSPRTAQTAAPARTPRPAVTVLKALCGAEAGLYHQLRSFCVQDYPALQLVFGVREAADPALQVVRRLQQEFPRLDLAVVIDPSLHGSNRKISNLINMLPAAQHDLLVMADSDIVAPRDYLSHVSAALADPGVGLVTCAYFGRSGGGMASQLGAMFINEWFMPSVLLAARFGARSFVSGATIALRREVLDTVGGLRKLADQLADDYKLGELVRGHGLRIVLSDIAVETSVEEPDIATLCRHELRWLRTIRSAQPLGYACCFPSFALPTALAGAALAGFDTTASVLLGIAAAARLVLHSFAGTGRARERWQRLALLPLRDALLAGLWGWSFCKREIVWREQRYGIGQDGSLHRVG
jgi:ceramide glucosyltransferase